eukprot:gene6627-7139_t
MEAVEPVKRKILLATLLVAVVAVVNEFDKEEEEKRRKRMKIEKEELNLMKNKFHIVLEKPLPLECRININDVFHDPARNYCKILTSLYGWEFFALAEKLKPLIESVRGNFNQRMGHKIKFNYYNRLYFVLFWLATGLEYKQMEFFFGWSSTNWEREIRHILCCIIRGLDNFLQWPSSNERQLMADQHTGLFKNCIGIIDAMETPIRKSKNRALESATYSGKQKTNTLKTLAVIDRRGRFRFVHTGTPGGLNDRDQFTSTVLFIKKQEYFDEDQFLAADGIYRGEGPILTSFNANQLSEDNSRSTFNNSFTEYRKGVENAFGRVQNWFPLLGNNKYKWNYKHFTLNVAVHAAARLHNWLLQVRDLNYDPTLDPAYLFTSYW